MFEARRIEVVTPLRAAVVSQSQTFTGTFRVRVWLRESRAAEAAKQLVIRLRHGKISALILIAYHHP